jgi:zinc transport system substrate-binding protein
MRALGHTAITLAACALLVACGDAETPTTPAGGGARAKPVVYTTFYPTTYFAKRLAGDDARVVCPLPDDEDPIFWKPDEETILAYQGADLIVVNGAEFEKWVPRASLPESRVVDTAASFSEGWVTFEKAVEHSHGPSGKHAHEGIDGHTWLSPVLAKAQSARIMGALMQLLPDSEARLRVMERHAALDADLDDLDARFQSLTKDYDGHALLASHPAYNYVARQYGWRVLSLDLDPGAMPDDAAFDEIRALLAETPARHILWESAPQADIAARFRRELGLESIVFSPCETPPDDGVDYVARMNENLDDVAPALAPWTD